MKVCRLCLISKDDNEFRKGHLQCKKCLYIRDQNNRNEEKKKNIYCIYRLYINNNTIYIGKCQMVDKKKRYTTHKRDCYNENGLCYNQYKYITLRQLGITKDNFYDYVKHEILYDNVPKEHSSIMEDLTMKLYSENGCNLWNEICGVYHKKEIDERYRNSENGKKIKNKWVINNKEKMKEYHKRNCQEKVKCDLCNLEMSKLSLNRHKKRKHN